MTAINPIGIFDSGVGGLSVLREIRRELPHEDLLYVADSGHAPYGDKPNHRIEERALAITKFLIRQHAKAIVVACNTATGAAVATLREQFSVPIIAIEPAIKPAAALTKSGVVGVLATSGTLASENFAKLTSRFGTEVEILVQACPGLVEQVEAGNLSGDKTRALLEQYLLPLLQQQADTLVLGCTHYPFLTALIQQIAGSQVTIIDPAAAVARELRRRLESAGLLSEQTRIGTEKFCTSGSPELAKVVMGQLWRGDVEVVELPNS
jgi:glutamate racemase